MDTLITIKTFTYPHEAFIIKGRLENEDIYCFLKDELTIQTDNFFSAAVGGVKLQVRESDYLRAEELLKATGYLNDNDFYIPAYATYLQDFDRFTQRIPLLQKQTVFFRFIFIIILSLILIAAFIYGIMSY